MLARMDSSLVRDLYRDRELYECVRITDVLEWVSGVYVTQRSGRHSRVAYPIEDPLRSDKRAGISSWRESSGKAD
jgi:hypothetical protein